MRVQIKVMPPESSATNGAQTVESETAASVEQPKLTRAQQDAAAREAFIAASDDDLIDAAKPDSATRHEPKKAKAKVEAPAPDDDEDADDADETAEAADDDEDLDDELEDVEDEEDAVEEELEDEVKDADPEVAKRLAKVQKREKHLLDRAAARDRAFEEQRSAFVAEWKPRIEASEAREKKFQDLKAKKDLPGLMKLLDIGEDDYEDYSKILWGLSKTGGADPKNKAAVAQLQIQRELREETAAARRESAEIKAMLAKRDEDAEASANVEKYLGRVDKAITSATPRVAKKLELAPKSTRAALLLTAHRLAEKAGGMVDPKKVVQAYEKKLQRAAELHRKLSGEETTEKPAAVAKKKPAIDVVDKTKKAAAASTTNGTAKPLFKSRREMIEDLRKIERGELDPEVD